MLFLLVETATAVQIEGLGSAVIKVLGTKKAVQKKVKVGKETFKAFHAKKNPKVLAVVQEGIYEPNCTHTWVVGVNLKRLKVTEVRVVEMSCPHAFPCKEKSFLSQFKGMGKKDLKRLKACEIDTIAKATGTSELTSHAVRKSILAAIKLKKK